MSNSIRRTKETRTTKARTTNRQRESTTEQFFTWRFAKYFWNRLQANLCRASTMTSMAPRPSFRMLLLTLTTRNTSTLRWIWKSSAPFSNFRTHQPRDNPIWIILKVEKQCIALNISIYNNLAACLLQLKDSKAERIKEVTEVVIELDSSNEKAWFRQVLVFVDKISSYLDEFP